jgi:trehalose synthase-fused probable maltokinase
MLQGLVKNEGDGWEWFLGKLEEFFGGDEKGAREQGSEGAEGQGQRDKGTEGQRKQGTGNREQGTERQGPGTRDLGTKGLGNASQLTDDLASQRVSESASQREEQKQIPCGNDRKKSKNNDRKNKDDDEAILAAGVLGRTTAEMHLALATPTADPAFRAEVFTAEDLTRDMLRMEEQADSALRALRARLASLPEDTADEAAAVLARRREMLARLRGMGASEPRGMRIRIHGDYHLGQTLHVASEDGGDFVILDFEGEPARTLAERRRKQSPLKDVAGMIRSFSYAAWFGMDRYRLLHKDEDEEALLCRAREWENGAREAFLSAYWEAMSERDDLLPPREQAVDLLSAYLLEKALYELLYELNNRPQWVRVPLAGIVGL